MKDFYSISEVAQQIGVPVYRIKYHIENGKLQWQGERFGTSRIFTKTDVTNIRNYFKKPTKGQAKS